ncbi:hypothetical protein AN958_02927 [Leucoagaricus sp. SymC.cos]|nr:hypothetical protein AN958_02927 [Leucoagaricus sp. SymC.cos]
MDSASTSRPALRKILKKEHNPFVRQRLKGMAAALGLFTTPYSLTYGKWMQSLYQVAVAQGHGFILWARWL